MHRPRRRVALKVAQRMRTLLEESFLRLQGVIRHACTADCHGAVPRTRRTKNRCGEVDFRWSGKARVTLETAGSTSHRVDPARVDVRPVCTCRAAYMTRNLLRRGSERLGHAEHSDSCCGWPRPTKISPARKHGGRDEARNHPTGDSEYPGVPRPTASRRLVPHPEFVSGTPCEPSCWPEPWRLLQATSITTAIRILP